MARGQVPMPAVEAAIGVLLLASVALSIAVGVPQASTETGQLDAYASDTVSILSNTAPQHREQTRLTELAGDRSAFERERAVVRRRIERILPANILYRLELPTGAVGFERPVGVPVGHATVYTIEGPITIRVWYA